MIMACLNKMADTLISKTFSQNINLQHFLKDWNFMSKGGASSGWDEL